MEQAKTIGLLKCLLIVSIATGAASTLSVAQENYPSKQIHLIVPFQPGGAADVVARVVSDSVSRRLQQSIVVENRPGATGATGSLAVARAAPDGYTILMAVMSSHAVAPATKKYRPSTRSVISRRSCGSAKVCKRSYCATASRHRT